MTEVYATGKQLIPGGHMFVTFEDDVDYLVLDMDDHVGPYCEACDKSACMHCHPEFLTEKCPSAMEDDA